MAWAAWRHPSARASVASFGTARVISEGSSGSPMTPVVATNTSEASQFNDSATDLATARTHAVPAFPVKALELPALAMMARAFPLPTFLAHHSTGAERVSERVNTP